MSATVAAPEQSVSSFQIVKEESIAAPVEIVFQAILDEIGSNNQLPDGSPFPLKLEAWPGGRWFRDLGNNTGHLWGHVQVIKPPTLLELIGPMPMSYPAVNHVQYRLTAQGSGTLLKFTHQAMGLISAPHRDGMPKGWEHWLKRIRETAEKRAGKK
jgi:uncharacterized protein YndB with AHSA1/START domain